MPCSRGCLAVRFECCSLLANTADTYAVSLHFYDNQLSLHSACMLNIQPIYVCVDECDVMMLIELAGPTKWDLGVRP